MPYIITVKDADVRIDPQVLSRTAVATLDEARAVANDAIYRVEGEADDSRALVGFYAQADALPDAGGTIGPLPDGTVIEVRHADTMDKA